MKNNVSLKKLQNVKFYLESFTKIKGKKVGNMIKFILNQAQVDLYNNVRKNSRVIILKARQIGFCQHPSTKVLTSNLEWVTLDEIKVGQSIVAVDENIAGGKGSARKIQTAIVENKFDVYDEAIKLTMDDGSELIATPSHKFLFKDSHKCTMEWKRVDELKIGDETGVLTKPWNNFSYEDGWFSGMIDGEGCLSKSSRTGVCLAVSQVSGRVWDRLINYAESNNINYRIEVDKRTAGTSSKLGSKEVNKLVISNMLDLLYVMGKTSPSRFKDRKFWEGKRLGFTIRPKVVKIENLGKQRMIDLQTSEHTYIANGFVSHNSTAMVGFFYHFTITNPGTTTALIGYNTDLTSELLDKVKTFYSTTPMELRPTIQYNSKHEVSFPALNSKILVLPSTETVGRGYTLTNVLATELAFWEKADEKMYALEASVPLAGKLVIESTPNGQGNLYHRIWMTDGNEYIKLKYGWWWGYSKNEIELIKRRMNNPLKFAQEFGCEFLASGRNVFDSNTIRKQRDNQLNVGDIVKLDDGTNHVVAEVDGLRIYKPPVQGSFYAAGSDVSEGVQGGDYSVMHIFERATGEEVAMFRGLLPPDIFGEKLNKWGRMYNNALMTVEVNNHGLTTLTILKNLLYPTLYFRPSKYETLSNPTSDKLGWKTTKVTRFILIDELSQACRDDDLTIHSKELLDEMSVFVYNDAGNMQPQETFHDDCLKKGTLIKTFNGYKEIEKIVPGDLVLTHLGRYKRVEKCIEKPFNGIWHDININGQLDLGLSYNHPLYVATGNYKGSVLLNYNKRQWKLPGELLRSYKPISIIEKFDNIKEKVIIGTDNMWGFGKKKIRIIFNKDFAKFLGLFLAEGHANKKSNQMSLAFHERDIKLLNEMDKYLISLGIRTQRIHIKEKHGRVLIFTSKTMRDLLRGCYDENNEKKIIDNYKVLGNNLKYVLEYWLIGDGWIDNRDVYDRIGATTSKKLGLTMRDIAWSSGYYSTIHKIKRHRYEVENKDQYYVNIKYTKNENQHLKKLSEFEYTSRIHKNTTSNYNGIVYNLQIEEDRSFIADGVVVHNCIFAAGIAFQGFKVLHSERPTQIDYSSHLPTTFSY